MTDKKTGSLPNGWALTKVGEISEVIQYGYTASSTEEPIGPRFLRITDLQDNTVNWETVPFCEIEEETKLRYLLKDGDLVFARTGATVGKSYLLLGNFPESVFASYLIRISFPKDVNKRFVSYFFKSPNYWTQINQSKVGIGQPNVNGTLLSQITVPFAPLNEQQRIVEEIETQFSRLDKAVEALKKTQTNLKNLRAATLKWACEGKLVPTEAELALRENREYEPADALLKRILKERRAKWEDDQLAKIQEQGKPTKDDKWKSKYVEPAAPDTKDLPELPEGWTWALTQQLGDIQLGRQRSPKNVSRDYPTKYIRAANITETGLDLSDILEMEFNPEEQKRYKLEYGDIVLSEASGSPTQVGKPAIWRDELPLCCFQNTVIRLRAVECDFNYLLYVFKQFYISGKFANVAAGVGINHLSANKFSLIEIPIPPLSEQKRIVAELEKRFSISDELETIINKNLQRAERLRQKILQDAFEGNLIEQNPDDEPASVLLEKIKTERERREAEFKQERKRKPKAMKQKTIKGRGLIEVLRESADPMTPEELFRNAGFNSEDDNEIEEFYRQMKEAYDSEIIDQDKHENGDVYLTAKA